MKRKIITGFDRLVVWLLGGLGLLTSCEDVITDAPMYGTVTVDYADYRVSGIVTARETGKPIEGIRVVSSPMGLLRPDTAYTNAQGQYQWKLVGIPLEYSLVRFEDIDGEANGGSFVTHDVRLDFTEADRTGEGDGQWYKGAFAKTADVAMDKQAAPSVE